MTRMEASSGAPADNVQSPQYGTLRNILRTLVWLGLLGHLGVSPSLAAPTEPAGSLLPLASTANDFLQPGTQPESLSDVLLRPSNCRDCHGDYDKTVEPYARWAGSMMAQATRDPVFQACLAIANQDLQEGGELCLRCHSPVGWLQGRSTPTDGSALDPEQGDFDGVSCHVCHRFVDPVSGPENPVEDQAILEALPARPLEPHTAQYIVDPAGNRRGPYDMGPGFPWHPWHESPFHQEALLCANCHDVSNPAFSRQPDGTYRLNELDKSHPTHDKRDEFPVERTFTEWNLSAFARAPIELEGRFGGNKTAVSTCQDCHLPDATGIACKPGLGGTERDDLPLHNFNGANSWVIQAVRSIYPDEDTGLSDEIVDDALARNHEMLALAADLQAFPRGNDLVVRVVNRTGHKLPTGYGEGRRAWLNVRFYDLDEQLLGELGHYDSATADLTTTGTKVYEIKQGLDDYMAGVSGLPAGESFHFVLNNSFIKDNRVPPRGFNNASFEAGQAGVFAHAYPDEHYWDDTLFPLPVGTVRFEVELFHQTTSREYIEFLRDENSTNTTGQEAYDLWVTFGKSSPVTMASNAAQLEEAGCATPIRYGLGSVDENQAQATLDWSGTPSLTEDDFSVTLRNGLAGGNARLLGGQATASVPFGTGQRLITAPKVIASAVIAADGSATFALPLADKPQWLGREIYLQVGFKDASGKGDFHMSEGLHVDICP